MSADRNSNGKFAKGKSGNPRGRPREEARTFTSGQVAKDFLELLDEKVPVTIGGKERRMPAIVAIYRRLIKLAADGDRQAIKLVVELRERYALQRERVLQGLIEQIQRIRDDYSQRNEIMPEHIWRLVEQADLSVQGGEYKAG